MAKDKVTIDGLLPGRFDIDRLRQKLDFAAAIAGHSVGGETVCALSGIPVDRIGTSEDSSLRGIPVQAICGLSYGTKHCC